MPTPEHAPKAPFGDYGIQKAAMEAFLLDQARKTGFPATIIHPGHIVGPGWAPLNPAGNFNPAVFSTLARGERLTLPNFGLETVHHVHADDVAGLIMAAIENWRARRLGPPPKPKALPAPPPRIAPPPSALDDEIPF